MTARQAVGCVVAALIVSGFAAFLLVLVVELQRILRAE